MTRDEIVADVVQRLRAASATPWSEQRLDLWLDVIESDCPRTEFLLDAAMHCIRTWSEPKPLPPAVFLRAYGELVRADALAHPEPSPEESEQLSLAEHRAQIAAVRERMARRVTE